MNDRLEAVRQLGRDHARISPPLTRTQFLDWLWIDIDDRVQGHSARELYAVYLSNRVYSQGLAGGSPSPVRAVR